MCGEANESLAGSEFLPPTPPLLLYLLCRLILPSSSFMTRLSFRLYLESVIFPPRYIYVDVDSVRTLWVDRRIIRGGWCVFVCMQGVTSCQNLAAVLLPDEAAVFVLENQTPQSWFKLLKVDIDMVVS